MAQDLLDTLEANKEHCVGMAANMIGINRRIIVDNIEPAVSIDGIIKSIYNLKAGEGK